MQYSLLLVCFAILLGGCTSRATVDGSEPTALPPCPDRPNCVNSEMTGSSSIAPLGFTGPPDKAWHTLQSTIEAAGGTVEQAGPRYLHATFRSRIFQFVDDLECLLDSDKQLIHIRSAARTGYYDFGVNRKRVEQLRQTFTAKLRKD